MSVRRFPEGFLLGVATSAQQIEGAVREDGRGESIWDRWAATPGKVEDGSDPIVACDHYHRWPDDLALMRGLGIRSYRFSLGWSRVLPDGRTPNPRGLDFYERLVDAMLAAGITPFATLNHWDLPQVLEDAGGWRSRDTVARFVAFTEAAASRLGDRVPYWVTHNEPWCVATLGHEQGHHAPGRRDPGEALAVAHHLLLSHGLALPVLRAHAPRAQAGITLILSPGEPASDSDADRDAARRHDGAFNRWYLDPLFRGRYPEDAIADRVRRGHLASPELPFVREGDLAAIATPADFLGINYYSRAVVRANEQGDPVSVPQAPPGELTDMGWEVHPRGLYETLVRLHRDYAPKAIHVTENGAAFTDADVREAPIADPRRVAYLREHLLAAHRAIEDGVPLRGYFVWSLMDNWEWSLGYAKRFGLHRVDFETQRRVARDSAAWYGEVARTGVIPDGVR